MNIASNSAKARLLLLLLASMVSASVVNTDGHLGVARTLSARPLLDFRLNVQFGVNYGQEQDLLRGPVDFGSKTVQAKPHDNATDTELTTIVDGARLLSGNFALGIGLAKIWDFALSLPLYYDWAGFGDLAGGGPGDLELSTKIGAPPAGKVWFNTLLLGAVLPTGNKYGYLPRHAVAWSIADSTPAVAEKFHTWDAVAIKLMYLTTLDFVDGSNAVPFAMHLNAGIEIPFDGSGRLLGIGGFALEYTPSPVVTLFADFNMEQRLDNFSAETLFRDRMNITPGIRIATPAGVFISIAYDACLSSKNSEDRQVWTTGDYTYSTVAGPTHGVQFMLGWRGFLNARARKAREIVRNPDSDGDGLCDPWVSEEGLSEKYAEVCKGIDKCPDAPEDIDGFEDEDGCPDLDNDQDGIPDDKDHCPNEPEDFDGFEDKDGCPDPDNDLDGIPDDQDRCPNDPEDIDGFEDEDGCADLDNDGDGILDIYDHCPNEAGHGTKDGCPPVEPPKQSTMPKHQIMRGIAYASGSAIMTPASYATLDPIVAEMKEFPEVEIEIRGHTDASGSYEINMRLSQQRAEAVLQYMASRGLDPRRMRAVGYGPSSPIADNRTAAGRTQNRRIEIVRLK